ncbi:PQQ-binding-like beta-propeller repeat protein [Cellulomonas sp. T2.31MG-18]|uniref:outer membrane protein assembly factor BamB family protein n=1 Tax=Cellulomonas sp. T2.31MG-18 TaxID=3157619 RepID=UPI00366DB676
MRITDQQANTTNASQVHLVVVDPKDGRVLAEHQLGAELSSLEAVLRGGLTVIATSRAGRPEVVAVDAASGAERWRAAVPAAGGLGGFGAVGFGDLVAVVGVTGLDVLGLDGAIHRSVSLTSYAGAMPRSDGRLVLPQEAATLVVGPDRDVRLDGTEVGIASDDGSLPGLTLVSAGTMRAYDADGHQRWELAGASPAGVVVLGGVVYVTRDGGVTAVDGSTGTVRWRTDLRGPLLTPLTDGRVLLVATGADLAALDLRTGAVLWRAALPSGHTDVMAFGGLLVARTPDGSSTDVMG